MASRTTRVAGSEVDGVGIIALSKTTPKKIILQKQFRPPVEGVCIEFPAGLIDPNETPLQCAIRELHEETGYVCSEADHLTSSNVLFNDAGFTNTNLISVSVEVDLTKPENVNPVPKLEPNEYIETFWVELAKLPEELESLAKQGYKVDSKVGSIAMGLTLARQFK